MMIVHSQSYPLIKCDETVNGSTTINDNIHRYSFQCNTSSSTITINACKSNYDTMLYLYDENNNTIASNDVGFHCNGPQSELYYAPLNIGNYSIGIGGYNKSYGQYIMQISCGKWHDYPKCMLYRNF